MQSSTSLPTDLYVRSHFSTMLADGYLHQQQALHQRIDLDAMMDEMYRWRCV